MISILLDTSYLITLADPGRAHHETAKRYLREALAQGFPLYLSAVVASEFQVGQPVSDLPLRNFHVLPFNNYRIVHLAADHGAHKDLTSYWKCSVEGTVCIVTFL